MSGASQQKAHADTVKGRHLPLRGGQDIPEEDGVPHAEDLLLIRGEGYSTHRLRVANVYLGRASITSLWTRSMSRIVCSQDLGIPM